MVLLGAEDVASVFIVLSIAFSAGVIFWQSFTKLLNPDPLSNLGWVALAAVVGFLGNEAVAWLQIRKGRKIGLAALVADGITWHTRNRSKTDYDRTSSERSGSLPALRATAM